MQAAARTERESWSALASLDGFVALVRDEPIEETPDTVVLSREEARALPVSGEALLEVLGSGE